MKKKMHNSAKAKTTSLIVLLVSVFLLSALAGVQFVGKVSAAWPYDWPMFRHDLQHTGYSDSPAPSTNQTLWNYTTGGDVYSSPAVVDGKVYIGSLDNNIYCLDAATGAFIWSYTTGGGVNYPAVAGGRVYVGSDDNKVYCVDALTGAHVWNYTTGGVVWGSPAVVDGKVYVGTYDDKKVYCLDASNGYLMWNYTTDQAVVSSPSVADGAVYIGSGDKNVYCLNASTGMRIWNYTTGGIVGSSPAVAGGVVYVGSFDDKVYAFSSDPYIPEGLTIGTMMLLSTVAVVVGVRYFRKRPKIENCSQVKL